MKSVLEILEGELKFLQSGGYRQVRWNPPLIFEDSPAVCLGNTRAGRGRSCLDCPLIDFVPVPQQKAAHPCRHIPLTEAGETLDALYRWGTPEEVEATVAEWLTNTIEEMRARQPTAGKPIELVRR